MIKMIFSDLDGTLLNGDSKLNQSVIDKIKEVQDKNIIFVPASGRDVVSTKNVLQGLDYDFSIQLNGAEYRNKYALIKEFAMDKDALQQCLDLIDFYKVPSMYYYNGHIYADISSKAMENAFKDSAKGFHIPKEQFRVEDGFCDKIIQIKDKYDVLNENLCKIECLYPNQEILDEMRDKLERIENIDIVHGHPFNLEISACNVNKKSMIQYIMNLNHLNEDEIMVIGDGDNDKEMLKAFPNSYAMENASDEVKSVCNYFVPSNLNDGIIVALDAAIKSTENDF